MFTILPLIRIVLENKNKSNQIFNKTLFFTYEIYLLKVMILNNLLIL